MTLRSMLRKAEEKSQASVISTKHGELRASTAFTWQRMGLYDALSDGSARLWPPLTSLARCCSNEERNYSRSRAVGEVAEGPKTWQDAGGGGNE
jgi:hypothetical protein